MLQILADKEAELKKLKKKVKQIDDDEKIIALEVIVDDSASAEIEKMANLANKSTLRDYIKNNSNFTYNLTQEQASKMGAFYPRRPMSPTDL